MTTYKEDAAQAGTGTGTGKLTLAEILEIFTSGEDLPLKFTAYDGSSTGPKDAQLGLDLNDPARHHVPRHRSRRPGVGARLRVR